jgi:hypothetical protein
VTTESISPEKKTRTYKKLGRKTEATSLQDLEHSSKTQQEIAEQHAVPRTTLQSWLYRNRGMQEQINPEVVAFYESPVGLAHLHQLMTSLLYTFHKASGCGLPTIQEFLKCSQLDQFVAKSIGALHKVSNAMDQVIIDFGKCERERLSAKMAKRNISIVGDETLLPNRMILVMMEPVSNYIIAEEVREKRDAVTWYDVCVSNLKGLNVKIIQLSSDEGSGLTCFATKLLGIHKAPDLFHVLQDITKSMGGHLARAVQNAEKRVEECSEKIHKAYSRAQDLLGASEGEESGIFEKEAKEASRWTKQKEEELKKLRKLKDDRELVSRTRKEIGSLYHPFCLETGKKRNPDELEVSLNVSYDQLETVLSRNGGSEKQEKKLAKSRRMVPSLKNTLAFFWCHVATLLADLSLDSAMQELFCYTLLPLSYLRTRLQRCRDKELKLVLKKAIESLEATLNCRDGPWLKLGEQERGSLTKKAEECSQTFQKSSSCVEGRNGVLSLIHHGHKRLSVQRLKVLSIIHNFGLTRRDNTTAAERFFGQAPKSLFDHLLNKMNWPLRPRRSWPSTATRAQA